MRPLVFATYSLLLAAVVFPTIAVADDAADTGAHKPSQAAADAIRNYTGTDGAFLAAGLVKDSYVKDNLASLLLYPTEQVVVVSLTGTQIRQAFERSVSLYPQPNSSFLQISGFEVTFNKNQPPNSRVLSITSQTGGRLEDSKTYTIAMPSSLQKGALGYYKIWDKANVIRKYDNVTLEGMLRGKPYVETSPRWLPQG